MKRFRKFALLLAVIVAVTSMPVAAGAAEGDAADSYSAAVREKVSADTGDGSESGQADQTDSEQTENGGSVPDEDSGKVTDSDKMRMIRRIQTAHPGESGDNDDPAAEPEDGTDGDENTGDGTDSEDPGAEPDGNEGEEPGTDDPADPAEPVTPAVTVN